MVELTTSALDSSKVGLIPLLSRGRKTVAYDLVIHLDGLTIRFMGMKVGGIRSLIDRLEEELRLDRLADDKPPLVGKKVDNKKASRSEST